MKTTKYVLLKYNDSSDSHIKESLMKGIIGVPENAAGRKIIRSATPSTPLYGAIYNCKLKQVQGIFTSWGKGFEHTKVVFEKVKTDPSEIWPVRVKAAITLAETTERGVPRADLVDMGIIVVKGSCQSISKENWESIRDSIIRV